MVPFLNAKISSLDRLTLSHYIIEHKCKMWILAKGMIVHQHQMCELSLQRDSSRPPRFIKAANSEWVKMREKPSQ